MAADRPRTWAVSRLYVSSFFFLDNASCLRLRSAIAAACSAVSAARAALRRPRPRFGSGPFSLQCAALMRSGQHRPRPTCSLETVAMCQAMACVKPLLSTARRERTEML